MDPTEDDVRGFATLADIIKWSELPGESEEKSSPCGSFLALFGAAPTLHPRSLGALPKNDFDAILTTWMISERKPTPVEATRAALIGRAARVAIGAQKRQAEVDAELKAVTDLAMAQAQASAKATSAVPIVEVRKVKMSQVIDQCSDIEVNILDEDAIKKGYDLVIGRSSSPFLPMILNCQPNS